VSSWDPAVTTGLLCLPYGRIVPARGLGEPPPGGETPEFAIYLLDQLPPAVPWPVRRVDRPDFGLPADPAGACSVFQGAWRRAAAEPVEVACWGGHGRTGTALVSVAVLDGLLAESAVEYVRGHYRSAAIETRAQEDFVANFP